MNVSVPFYGTSHMATIGWQACNQQLLLCTCKCWLCSYWLKSIRNVLFLIISSENIHFQGFEFSTWCHAIDTPLAWTNPETRKDDSLIMATIHDETWKVLNMQHITPNSKRWDYSDIPGCGVWKIKDLHTWLMVATKTPPPPPFFEKERSVASRDNYALVAIFIFAEK